MQLSPYVDELKAQLMAAAEAGGPEAQAVAARLLGALDAATRLVLLDALSTAAGEITSELAPTSVDVRLRGTDPEFVVAVPEVRDPDAEAPTVAAGSPLDDGGTARTTLRLPETLKQQIEDAAAREGLSLNTWLVRLAAAAVQPGHPASRPGPSAGQRFTGWAH